MNQMEIVHLSVIGASLAVGKNLPEVPGWEEPLEKENGKAF